MHLTKPTHLDKPLPTSNNAGEKIDGNFSLLLKAKRENENYKLERCWSTSTSKERWTWIHAGYRYRYYLYAGDEGTKIGSNCIRCVT